MEGSLMDTRTAPFPSGSDLRAGLRSHASSLMAARVLRPAGKSVERGQRRTAAKREGQSTLIVLRQAATVSQAVT